MVLGTLWKSLFTFCLYFVLNKRNKVLGTRHFVYQSVFTTERGDIISDDRHLCNHLGQQRDNMTQATRLSKIFRVKKESGMFLPVEFHLLLLFCNSRVRNDLHDCRLSVSLFHFIFTWYRPIKSLPWSLAYLSTQYNLPHEFSVS